MKKILSIIGIILEGLAALTLLFCGVIVAAGDALTHKAYIAYALLRQYDPRMAWVAFVVVALLVIHAIYLWRRVSKKFSLLCSYVALVLEPLLVSSATTVGWYFLFYKRGWCFPNTKDLTIPVLLGLFGGVLIFHAILAAFVLKRVVEGRDLMVDCISNPDRDQGKQSFIGLLQKRIPKAVHVLLAVLSLTGWLTIAVVDYQGQTPLGAFAVMVTAFVLLLYWKVATDLDNPARSVLFAMDIPEEWQEHLMSRRQRLRRQRAAGQDNSSDTSV